MATGLELTKRGALTSQRINDLITAGFITGAKTENVKPGSLDLTLSDEIYKVEGIFQPHPKESVREVLNHIKKTKFSFEEVLQRDQMYIARLNEKMRLPQTVYGTCNPKSSSGRIDLHVRLLADAVPRYDVLMPAGWQGELWVSIMPKTFPVKLYPGVSLNQLRLFNGDTRFTDTELEIAMEQYGLLWNQQEKKPIKYSELTINDRDGSIVQTLDLSGDVIGYVGVASDKVIDLSKTYFYDWKDFFLPLERTGGFLYLKKNHFYILSTLEAVRVPPELACEMVPMDERSGEFRSHYAGFIDPGWGYGKTGEGNGRPLTLEVRPFEDIILRHVQPIAKIRFEKMMELPEVVYDAISSNYSAQSGPRLGKHFKI